MNRTRTTNRPNRRAFLGLPLALMTAPLFLGGADGPPRPGDDLTFRPTVIVRKGDGQGSGTIVASVAGEALVLTAAHVVDEPGEVAVELHRYNLGAEGRAVAGTWPVRVRGEVAAADRAGDVAVVRLRRLPPLPYVARLSAPGDGPARGATVTSVGVDGGDALKSWATRVRGVAWFSMGHSNRGTAMAQVGGADDRPFLITERPPLEGRSGGGLFLDGGRLAGVCVGRVEMGGHVRGVFASPDSVRKLLREHGLDAVVVRSEASRPASSAPTLVPTRSPSRPHSRSASPAGR